LRISREISHHAKEIVGILDRTVNGEQIRHRASNEALHRHFRIHFLILGEIKSTLSSSVKKDSVCNRLTINKRDFKLTKLFSILQKMATTVGEIILSEEMIVAQSDKIATRTNG
jgi:hypothetical protein